MILIDHIGRLVTMGGVPAPRRGAAMLDTGVVKKAAVLVDGDRIVAIGPRRGVLKHERAKGAAVYDAGGAAVVPGFVDPHTHPVFAKTRHEEYERKIRGESYERIAKAGGGILASVRAARLAHEDVLTEIAVRHAHWFLEHGTTTIEAKSGYGLDEATELKLLRVIRRMAEQTPLEVAPTFLGAHEIPPEYRDDREGYLRLLCDRLIPAVADQGLAEYVDVYCDEHVFTPEEMVRVFRAAARRGLAARAHVEQLTHTGGTLAALGAKAVSVDHLEKIGPAEIASLAASEAAAVLLPGSVFHRGVDDYPPGRALVDAGALVALATDFNPGSAPSPSMPMAMALACNRMKLVPAEALTAATVNAAEAIGRTDRVGRLEPGMQADLVVLRFEDERLIPYHFGMNPVKRVMKRGRWV